MAINRHQPKPPGTKLPDRLSIAQARRIALDEGVSTVSVVAWNAEDPTERMNLPDTVKVQWTTGLGKGRVIFSDMGKVMFSITEDSCGAHDVLMGGSTASSNAKKYAGQNGPALRNTRDNFVLIATKSGLDKRDIPAALALFAPVRVDADGRFEWKPDLVSDGDYVDLRAEMDMIVTATSDYRSRGISQSLGDPAAQLVELRSPGRERFLTLLSLPRAPDRQREVAVVGKTRDHVPV